MTAGRSLVGRSKWEWLSDMTMRRCARNDMAASLDQYHPLSASGGVAFSSGGDSSSEMK